MIDHGTFTLYVPDLPEIPAEPERPPIPIEPEITEDMGHAEANLLRANYRVALRVYDSEYAAWAINHAAWEMIEEKARFVRDALAVNALFARNESGDDWYEVSKAIQGRRIVILSGDVVSQIVTDATAVFPTDGRVIETDAPAVVGAVFDGASFDGVSDRLINKERTRRINAGMEYDFGAIYGTKIIDTDDRSRARAGQQLIIASNAVAGGKEAGDYAWLDDGEPYAWITADGTVVPRDAPQTVALCTAILAHESRIIRRARMLKNMNPIPRNYREHAYWADSG